MGVSFLFLILLALAGLLGLGGLVVTVLLLANEKTRAAGVVLLVAMLIAGPLLIGGVIAYSAMLHVQSLIAPPTAVRMLPVPMPPVQMPPMPMPPMPPVPPMPPMPPMPPVEAMPLPDAAAPSMIEASPLDGRIENEPSVSPANVVPENQKNTKDQENAVNQEDTVNGAVPSADAAAAGSNASEPESEAAQ